MWFLGPGTAFNLALRDTLPELTTAFGFSPDTSGSVGNVLFWDFDSLAPGDSVVISYQFSVNSGVARDTAMVLVNQSVVESPNDPPLSNNFAQASVFTSGALCPPAGGFGADLDLIKTSEFDSLCLPFGKKDNFGSMPASACSILFTLLQIKK